MDPTFRAKDRPNPARLAPHPGELPPEPCHLGTVDQDLDSLIHAASGATKLESCPEHRSLASNATAQQDGLIPGVLGAV